MAVVYLCYLSFLFWGSFGSTVSRDAVHRNARQRRRICTGLNPTSMNKCMSYISGMVVRTSGASITEEIDNSYKTKEKTIYAPYTEGYCDGRSLYLCYLSFLFWGSFGSAVGREAVHRNARRRRRIRTGSNPTSMNK